MITLAELKTFLGNAVPTWVTATAYNINQFVINSNLYYKCLIAHTSGVFATDLAAGKWVLTSQFTVNDTFLTTCMNSAIDYVNSYCNRDFRAAEFTEIYNGNGTNEIYLKNYPIDSTNKVSEIKVWDDDSDAFIDLLVSPDTLADTLRYDFEQGRIFLLKGYAFTEGESNIQIKYKTGQITNINVIKEATTYKAARMFFLSNLGQSFFALTSKNLGGQSTAGMSIENEADFNKWLKENFLVQYRQINV